MNVNICDSSMGGVTMRSPGADIGTFEKIRKAIDEKLSVNVLIMNYHKDGTPFWNDLYIRQTDRSNR